MAKLLGLVILSFIITFILLIPFIDFLYKIKFQREKQETKDPFNKRTPIFDKFHGWKVGTPFGGGMLVIIVVSILTLWSYGIFNVTINGWELLCLAIAFIGYGLLGLYDDSKKLFSHGKSVNFFGLRMRYKILIQIVLAITISVIMYTKLGYSFIFIRGIGLTSLGFLFIPIATFAIVSFVNAANITDGLDGLASGLFLICLVAFLAITASQLDDSLGIFIAILMGSMGSFLYFNVYKARLWLGDVGSLPMGAIIAVIGLLSGKIIALGIIGGVFVLEVGSSLIQLISKRFFARKVFVAAPLHLGLQRRGWEEPKIVMRAWLLGFFFAVVGLYIALIH